jgi:hypothetical protein
MIEMRVERIFVWTDGRPDGHDEIRSLEIPHRVTHRGSCFELRAWDVRYPQGQERVTDAIFGLKKRAASGAQIRS